MNIKPCPFCGSEPDVFVEPLWNGSHGYHGAYEVYVGCTCDKCHVRPKTSSLNTIYGKTKSEQIKESVNVWNDRPA